MDRDRNHQPRDRNGTGETEPWDGHATSRRWHGDGIPDFEAARRCVIAEIVRFANRLRNRGVTVPPTGTIDAGRALATLGLDDRRRVAAALRTTLVSDVDDIPTFEAEFPEFWRRLRSGLEGIALADPNDEERRGDRSPTVAVTGATDEPALEAQTPPETEGDGPDGEPDLRIRTSRREASGDRPVAAGDGSIRRFSAIGRRQPVAVQAQRLTASERAHVDRFVDALAGLPGRRDRPARHGRRLDVGRTLRASLETGGAPIDLPERAPVRSELRCCLLIDVSGSVLDTIDRATLVSVVATLHRTARHARTFLFDTDLTEVTEIVEGNRSGKDIGAALQAADVQWGGGTQIGSAFHAVRRRAPEAVDRRTVVVIVSDGLDVGDDEALETGMIWLRRRARAIVWLNPLAVTARYEPTASGMAICVQYLDGLFGFVGPTDLGVAAEQLEHRGIGGPVGFEYDRRRQEVADS